ncbi:hypothetical protein H0H93_007597 [Arthromyces matolae]|nr:hypothetical protein H0H93_007597 [Arthromyces matolae]
MDPHSLSGETKQPYLEKPRLVVIQDTKIEDFSFPIFVEIVPMFTMEDDDTSAEAVIELPSDEAIQKIEGHPKNTSELASTYNTHEILKNQEDLASLLQDDDWDLEYVDSENLPHQPSQDTLVILTSEKEKASSRDDTAPDPGEYVDSLEESSIQGPPTTSSVTDIEPLKPQPVLDTPDFDDPGLINALDHLPANQQANDHDDSDIVMELWNEVLMETNLNIQATSNVITQGPENVDDPSKRLQPYTDLDKSIHPEKDQLPLDSPASLFTRELEPEGQTSNSHDIQSGAPEVATETDIRFIDEPEIEIPTTEGPSLAITSVDVPDSNIIGIQNSPFLSLGSPAPREGSEVPITRVLNDTELTATNPNEEPQSMVSDDLWPVTNSDEIQHSLDISTRTFSRELEYLTIDQKEGILHTANLNDARSAPVPLSRVTDASQSSAPLEDLDTSIGTPIRPRNVKRKRLILDAVEISLLSPAMKKMYRKPSTNGGPHDAESFRSKQVISTASEFDLKEPKIH